MGELRAKMDKTIVSDKSGNAVRAEDRGLFVKENIEEQKLRQQGFLYSKDFFQWLCEQGYIRPKEYHHSGLKIVAFYDISCISYAVEHFDLEFLHRFYIGEISYFDALKEKEISFCRVKAVSELIGFAGGNPVLADCVKQRDTIWFSKKKYIRMQEDKVLILAEWDSQPEVFRNPNTRKIIRMLFSLKKRKVRRVLI